MQEDIGIRELRDFSQSMMQKVGNLVTKQPELESTLQLLFSQVHEMIQWNPSNLDTIGPEESVLIREVSLFQGLKSTQTGRKKVSLFQGLKSIRIWGGRKCPD